jgi:hypothetical protein
MYETLQYHYKSHFYGSTFLFGVSTGGFRSHRGGAQHHHASIADSRVCPGIVPLQPLQGQNQIHVYKKAMTVD